MAAPLAKCTEESNAWKTITKTCHCVLATKPVNELACEAVLCNHCRLAISSLTPVLPFPQAELWFGEARFRCQLCPEGGDNRVHRRLTFGLSTAGHLSSKLPVA